MGRKLDALFGRKNFRTPKLKPLVNLSFSRLVILKNQKQARCSLVRTDIIQLLKLGHHDPALVRVEQLIKDQNMLDVFAMIETYCHLLADRINLIEQEKGCPEELNEAISSLIYASTRCGEFPELVELRSVFTSQYGKEFVARAVELRNNCRVNPKMIQKLSTRQPSLESRLKVLQEIASENDIVLQIEEATPVTEGNIETEQKQHQPKRESSTNSSGSMAGHVFYSFSEDMESLEGSSRKYKDVAEAAEAAFKSAAYAAAAARAAVELSRSQSHDPDDQNSRGTSPIKREVDDRLKDRSDFSESEHELIPSQMVNSDENALGKTDSIEKEIKYDGSDDDETGNEQGIERLPNNEGLDSISAYTFVDEERYKSDDAETPKARDSFFLRSEAGLEEDLEPVNSEYHTERYKIHGAKRINFEKGPSSVRTRRERGS